MTAADQIVEPPKSRRLLSSLADQPAAPWLAIGVAGLAFHAVVHVECPFREATGWDCPACGGTRALGNVLHGQIVGAVHDNVVALFVGVVLLLGFIPGIRASRSGRMFHSLVSDRSPLVWVGLLIAWTLMRNLPGLTWLSPDR